MGICILQVRRVSLVSSEGHWDDPQIEKASLQQQEAHGLFFSPFLELNGCGKRGLLFLQV